jgi:hypothetical protein
MSENVSTVDFDVFRASPSTQTAWSAETAESDTAKQPTTSSKRLSAVDLV